jgi:hypothetical protein
LIPLKEFYSQLSNPEYILAEKKSEEISIEDKVMNQSGLLFKKRFFSFFILSF